MALCSGHSLRTLKIAVELNTRITNAIGDERVVKLETAPLTYESGGIDLVAHELDADAAFADSNQPSDNG